MEYKAKNFKHVITKKSPKILHGIVNNNCIVANCGSDDAQLCNHRANELATKNAINWPELKQNQIYIHFLGNSLSGLELHDGETGLFQLLPDTQNYTIDVFYETIHNENNVLVARAGDMVLLNHDNGVPFVRKIAKIYEENENIKIKTIYSDTIGTIKHDTHHYDINRIHAKLIEKI